MGAKAKKRVRTPFLIAMGVALVGFGVISGIAFDVATRPAPRPQLMPAADAHASRAAPMPHVVAPVEAKGGSIFDGDDARRGYGSDTLRAGGNDALRAWAADQQATPLEPSRPPLAAFAVPTAADPARPVLAIVIDDLGLDRPRALRAIALKGPLTLSIMTYADNPQELVKQAHDNGHEVMAHLPMEPVNPKENPGRGALTSKMDDDAIRKALAGDLDGWSGYVGINNHMGSKFTADRNRMAVVMEELKARGLMWLDSRTINDSSGPGAARAIGVPFITRDIFLDNVETLDAIRVQLELAKTTARNHGTAVAIGHPHEATLIALKEWLPTLEQAGVALVPATEILKRRTEKAPG